MLYFVFGTERGIMVVIMLLLLQNIKFIDRKLILQSVAKNIILLLKALRKQAIESSPRTSWLSLKAPWQQANFQWNLSESRMAFVESSTKTFQKAHEVWQYC